MNQVLPPSQQPSFSSDPQASSRHFVAYKPLACREGARSLLGVGWQLSAVCSLGREPLPGFKLLNKPGWALASYSVSSFLTVHEYVHEPHLAC